MKGKYLTRLLALAFAAAMILSLAPAAFADGSVTYTAGRTFVYSLGDKALFQFEGVMPGDVRTAKVTVGNTSGYDVRVYLRADPGRESTAGFLSQLRFDVSAGSTVLNVNALTGDQAWPDSGYLDSSLYYISLGRVNRGQSVDIDVSMTVPIKTGNAYQEAWGQIIWTVCIMEIIPYNPPNGSPVPLGPPAVSVNDIPLGSPGTGGDGGVYTVVFICLAAVSAILGGTVYFAGRKKKTR